MSTNTTKKVTKAQRNSDIIALLQSEPVQYGTTVEDAIAHLTHENALLAKKNTTKSGEKKLTADQKKAIEYRGAILSYLRSKPDLLVTASDMMDYLRGLYPDAMWSNQRAASLLNSMSDKYDKETEELISEGKLNRTEGKGKTKTTWQIKPEYVTVEEETEDGTDAE